MTPAARLSAVISILDRVLGGVAAEQALTNWARGSRFAGSGDRAAVRDLVFDALRCKRSFAARGGAMTGRGLIIGGLRDAGAPIDALFTGDGHAPPALSMTERENAADLTELEALDCPDWLAPALRDSLGDDFAAVMVALRQRAPAFLRVNLARLSRDAAQKALTNDNIATTSHTLAQSALEVTGNTRKISGSSSYLDGSVELQDAASQAVVEALPLSPGQRVLDYCAGGGGKSLAMAARTGLHLHAHDADPRRMRDLPARAARAGIVVHLLDTAGIARAAPFDLVLADVPCSGSGSWRRAPEAKWALTPERLVQLCALQTEILDKAAAFVSQDGYLAYATCSLLRAENDDQIDAFLARSAGWGQLARHRFTPLQGGDGFFLSVLTRR